eukprot:m.565362 g.565362  ORF g.565362 m.565362 type:complete len:404 (+) comp57824_c0_seq4:875-2086(+)
MRCSTSTRAGRRGCQRRLALHTCASCSQTPSLNTQTYHNTMSSISACPSTTAQRVALGFRLPSGSRTFIRRKFSASNFWKDCVEHECTVTMYIGELCRYLLNTKPSQYDTQHKIRVAIGNGLRPEIWSEFQKRFHVPLMCEFYAATEGNVVLVNAFHKVGAVGYMPAITNAAGIYKIIKIDEISEQPVMKEGRCVECKAGEVGEMIGKVIARDRAREFQGYTDPKATAKKILEGAFKSGDKYFRTGDLMMKDKEGFIFFVDRIGDTFRWKGENVSTTEVSSVMSKAAGVEEANVYGVRVPNQDGRCGMAALRVQTGYEAHLTDWYQQTAHQLPTYARPLFLRILSSDMQMTGTFKQRKVELVQEGFDVTKLSDTILMRDESNKTYSVLSAAAYADIVNGVTRL